MSRSTGRTRRRKEIPAWITVAVLLLLAAVAVTAAYAALTGGGADRNQGFPLRSATPTSTASVAEEPAQPAVQVAAAPPQRLLTGTANTTVRATAGSCEASGLVEFSVDERQNWNELSALREMGATQILRLSITEPSTIEVVAHDQNCEPQVFRTPDLGLTWEGPFPAAGSWYLSPSQPGEVGAPEGIRPLPCDGAELAAAGERAAVRCLDGTVITSTDQANSWTAVPDLEGVVAISDTADSYLVVSTGDGGCQGLRLITLTNPVSPNGCFEIPLEPGAFDPALIALTQFDSSTLMWVQDDLVVSPDQGRTWL